MKDNELPTKPGPAAPGETGLTTNLQIEIMRTPNRPPSVDLPAEFYDQHKCIKPCPLCGHEGVGWGGGDIYINEFANDEVAVQCDHCGAQINDRTHRKSKGAAVKAWNSLPRRSEVLELLRLVHEVCDWEDSLVNTSEFYEDGKAYISDINRMRACADKLRKEMGV